MITYHPGDLFQTPDRMIAHGCNAQGVMGAGVAKQLKERFPWAYQDYRQRCADWIDNGVAQKDMLGSVFTVVHPESGICIFNCITQNLYGTEERLVSYDAVDRCFAQIKSIMEMVGDERISIPKIGAGLGGGSWQVIEAIIDEQLRGFTVNCYLGEK